jgi:hypothetical protein
MNFIQRNFPFLIGWLAYYGLKTVFNMAFLWALYHAAQYFFQNVSNAAIWVLVIISSCLSGFLGFLLSAKWITLPLSQPLMEKKSLTVNSLLGTWIILGALVFLIGRAPVMIVGSLLAQKDIGNLIAYTWIYFISFYMYRELLSSPAPLPVDNLQEKENPLGTGL